MTEKTFVLFGFACGRSEPPQFVEPVFLWAEKLWVQSAPPGSEKVVDFIEYNEDIEILESSSREELQVGDNRMFAVRDIGDRIVCGDRAYVSKYLAQNLRSYLDKPYFLSDASRFSEQVMPDMSFINTDSDLIEAAALAGSLRRFCEQELYTKDWNYDSGERSTLRIYYSRDTISRILSGSEKQTIFGQWLEFAEKDAPRLSKSTKWKNIDENYHVIFSKKRKFPSRYTFLYLKIAQLLLDQINLEPTSIKVLSELKNSSDHFLFDDISEPALSRMLKIRESVGNADKRILNTNRWKSIANYMLRSIVGSVEEKRISKVEISMSVFFLNLVIKFTMEKMQDK